MTEKVKSIMTKATKSPRILILDIETLPLETYTWGIWDQNIGLPMIKNDWSILSWAAKWLGDPPSKVMYADQRDSKDVRNDKKLLKGIWDLMNEADVIIGQNSNSFDNKKLNARFLLNGFPPPTGYKKLDTKVIAKKYFALTSNRLEFMAEKINKKYKKLSHEKYPGFAMWLAAMAGDKKVWPVLKKYNVHDVLATEELFQTFVKWDPSINFNIYREDEDHVCSCGSKEFKLNGYAYTAAGKFQRFVCKECGKESRSKTNLLSKEKKQSLRR